MYIMDDISVPILYINVPQENMHHSNSVNFIINDVQNAHDKNISGLQKGVLSCYLANCKWLNRPHFNFKYTNLQFLHCIISSNYQNVLMIRLQQ